MPYEPEGNPETASLVLVGEAPASREIQEGRPFVGPAGWVLNECLESAGISRAKCYITNVFDFKVKKPKGTPFGRSEKIFNEFDELLWTPRSGFTEQGRRSVNRLGLELSKTKANVIVPLGNPALSAICGKTSIMKWRGSIIESTLLAGRKCVPSIHPANALHGQYINRYLIRYDLLKARQQMAFPEIRRPPYSFLLYPTFHQCMEILSFLKTRKVITIDIEMGLSQISRISFAWSETEAVTIPYGDGNWPLEKEAALMKAAAELLETEGIVKIFQNGMFDIWIFLYLWGVVVAPPIEDTMVAHHIMYPDFPKSLAFLCSIYTDQPFYKDMVSHGSVEKGDG